MINQSLILWDFNLKNENVIDHTKALIRRFYEVLIFNFYFMKKFFCLKIEVKQIEYNREMKNLTLKKKIKIGFIRFLFHFFTILMFALAGVALYYLNEFTLKVNF